jgi:DnaJ-class molecular chaperone
MDIVCNLAEAKCWFLDNSSGSVLCVRNGEEKTVSAFPDAKAFFSDATCPRCDGTGEGDNSPNVNCPQCDGSGEA